jgi:dolichyl-phosphate beta-glucosyltransferase
MQDPLSICIVIPFYNEETRFPTEEFLEFYDTTTERISFCLVNDGSTDRTMPLIETLKQGREHRILAVDLAKNGGKAAAIREGMQRAVVWKNCDAFAYFDADLATPLTEVFLLEKYLTAGAFVMSFGSRILRLGTNVYRSRFRHYVGRVFATAASIALNLPVYDTQCGAKLLRAEVVGTAFDEPFLNPWLFDVEIFFRLTRHVGRERVHQSLVEVPLNTWIEKGDSKIKSSQIFRMPFDLWAIWRKYH